MKNLVWALCRPLFVLLVVMLCVTGRCAYAYDTSLVVNPATVRKGSTQPIRIEWPTTPGTGDTGLENAKTVTVGGDGQKATLEGPATASSITVTLPASEFTGLAEVRVKDGQSLIGTAMLNYVAASDASTTPGVAWHPPVLVFYALLLVLFPFALMWTDILKAYKFARESRKELIAMFSPDKLTLDELKLLVADFDSSPPGIPGLARATLALTLLLLLGLILFYVLVVCGKDIPPNVDKLLTALTTAFASTIAFYFGTRAAETGAQNAAKGDQRPLPPGAKPGVLTPGAPTPGALTPGAATPGAAPGAATP